MQCVPFVHLSLPRSPNGAPIWRDTHPRTFFHTNPQHMSPLPGFPARPLSKEVPISRAFFWLGSEQMFWFDMCKTMWVHRCKCILICHMKVNLQLCLLLQKVLMNFRCRRWNSKWVLPTEVLLCLYQGNSHRGLSVSSAICTEWRY